MNRIDRSARSTRRRYFAFAAASALAVLTWIPGDPSSLRALRAEGDGPRHNDEGRQGSVWVVNRDLGELTVFDARSGNPVARVPVGAGAHDICISEYSRKAYVAAEAINTVTTVDLRTLATESIDVGPLPHHLEPSRDGRTVYVTLASHTPSTGAAQYAAIDTATNAVEYVTSSANPNARPHAVYPSRDGQTLFIAHDSGDEMTAIDLPTRTIDFRIGPIVRAEEAIATRGGTFLWVSARGEGSVKRIKVGRNQVTGSVNVGVQPESVMLTPSERTLVVSLRGEPAAASLAFVDTVNLVLERKIAIAPAGTLGDLAVMTPDGEYVYATFDYGPGNPTPGGVAVVHVPTRTVVSTWTYPGTGRPHGVWYSSRKAKF
jgi:DNA-binding beta-propeller fold protein YncE